MSCIEWEGMEVKSRVLHKSGKGWRGNHVSCIRVGRNRGEVTCPA